MKFYSVSKAELERVGETSFDITLYFSLASFFFSQALDVAKQTVFNSAPQSADGFARWVQIISAGLAILFAGAGLVKLWRKGSYFRLIREEHGEEVAVWPSWATVGGRGQQQETGTTP